MKKIKLSLVVPFFNEEKIIKKTIFVLNSYLDKKYPDNFELLFVNDGSKDKSLQIVEKEIKKYPHSRLISYKRNKGRGYAVSKGFKEARGKVIGFIDSDLEVSPKYIDECMEKLKTNDVAVISKFAKGSKVKTTLLRKITSKFFSLLVGFILDWDLADHQGGLKLAKKDVVRRVLPNVKARGWLFDLEFLYYAKKKGFKTAKVPINIRYGFRRVRTSLGFDFLKSLILIFKLRFDNRYYKEITGLFIVSFLFLLTIFAYRNLRATFFQQDEWQFFGANIYTLSSSNPIANVLLPFGGQLTHFYPLSNLLFLLEYLFFRTTFAPYAYVAVILHFINVVLVYFLLQKITKNYLISFLAASLFSVSGISHQALTWVLVSVANLPATTFLLLSLIFFYDFLKNEKAKFLVWSLLFLVISLLFKEVSVFLFVFYAICFFIFRFSKKYLFFVLGGAGIYFFFRVFFLFSSVRSEQPEVGDVSATSLLVYVLRLFLVPLKGIAQSFLPQRLLIGISGAFSANEIFAQTVIFSNICYILSIILIFIIVRYIFYLKQKGKVYFANIILFSGIFLIFSFLPFVFIPGKAGDFSIFEPRNLYIPVIVSSFLIVILSGEFSKIFTDKYRNVVFLASILFVAILNINIINGDLNIQKNIGKTRLSLLETVQRDYPNLPKTVIIYTKSDRSYYGLPEQEKILPVQSGFGRMLMVWYQDKEKFPGCLYANQFLHDLLSQGYKYCGGRGFGYFRDYDKLVNELKINKLSIDSIIAYQWMGDKSIFFNISDEIRSGIEDK